MTLAWFRFHNSVVNDPKVQRLPDSHFKAWVNLLCLASMNNGILPALEDVAYALRRDEKETSEILEQLSTLGLFDETEAGLKPHNWDGRQYKSDVSTERVKRFRKRQGNVSGNVSETAPDTEQNRSEQTQMRARGNVSETFHSKDPWIKLRGEIVEAATRFNSPASLASAHIVDEWKAQNLPLDLCRAVALPGIERAPDKGLAYWGKAIRGKLAESLPAPAKAESGAERDARWEKTVRERDAARPRPYRTPPEIPPEFVKHIQDKIDAEKRASAEIDLTIPESLRRTA